MQIPILSRVRLGRALRDARRERDLTQHQLSALSGVAQPTISNIERATSATSVDTLLRLLNCLELELLIECRPALNDAELWERTD